VPVLQLGARWMTMLVWMNYKNKNNKK